MKRSCVGLAAVTLCMALLLWPAPSKAQTAAPELLQRIERFEAGFDPANRLSGVLLIARGDSIVFHHAFGWADPTRNQPMRLDTPIPVASITKIFTQIAVVQLLREGRLRLDDRLSRWLPSFPGAGEITVSHLVNHRAGIRHRVTNPEEERTLHTAAEIVAFASRYPAGFAAGSVSSYSTAGYAVLARVLELADGRPYHELLASRIFAAADMTSSFDLTDPMPPKQSAGSFLPREGRLVPAPPRHLSYLVGGGSSVASAEDLFRLVRRLRSGRLPGAMFEEIVPRGSARWIGASAGYFGWVDVGLPDDQTIVWLGNTWGGAGPALMDALPALLRGESPSPPVTPPSTPWPPAAQLATLAGAYQTRVGAESIVRVENGLQLDDNYLVPIGEDLFWQPAWSQPVRFVRDSLGAVVALERGSGTDRARWPRVR